jgi:hypothetical protein
MWIQADFGTFKVCRGAKVPVRRQSTFYLRHCQCSLRFRYLTFDDPEHISLNDCASTPRESSGDILMIHRCVQHGVSPIESPARPQLVHWLWNLDSAKAVYGSYYGRAASCDQSYLVVFEWWNLFVEHDMFRTRAKRINVLSLTSSRKEKGPPILMLVS